MLEPKEGDKKCAYCGSRATDKEHVVPKINFHQDGKPHLRYHLHINNLVWSCHECNLLAGSETFQNFWDKKKFIGDRLRGRYKRILASPNWKREEIRELKGKVKAHVFSLEKFKEQLKARLENLDKPEICGDVERSNVELL